MNAIAAAIAIAKEFPVFAIKPRDKKPLTEHGFKDATKDEQRIRGQFAGHPDANIGIATGAASGLLVVDVDAEKGGLQSLDAWEQQHGALNTRRHRTGGGGLHLLFKYPNRKIGNRTGIAPGVDVRGDGGYIVMPPSVHASGKSYTVENPETPIAELPSWLLSVIMPAAAHRTLAPDQSARDAGYAAAALRNEVDRTRTAGQGARNDTLNRAAYNLGQLVGAGTLTRGTVEAALESAAVEAGLVRDDGMTSVRATIKSGLDDGTRSPRQLPAPRARPAAAKHVRENDSDGESTWMSLERVMDAFGRGETGDAELLAALFADKIAYDHTEHKWYLWSCAHWQPDRTAQVGHLVTNDVAAQYLHAAAEFKREGTKDAEEKVKELYHRAGALRFRNKIANVLTLAQSQPALALSGDQWDADPLLLGVANGVIDLHTGELRQANPKDYIRTASPIAWDGLDTPAVRWEQFLWEILARDDELPAFLQRLLGYGISGLTTEHVLPILWGAGRNGKETLLETIAHVLGPMAGAASEGVLMDNGKNPHGATPELYALRGQRLVWVSETNEGARLNAGQVKHLTGGGQIRARALYSEPITFKPTHLLMLITNYRPHANADDYALWKRMLLIPLTQSFIDDPKAENEHLRDPHLLEALRAESAGILAWLVRGFLEFQRVGLQPPVTVRTATEDYQAEEDTVQQFIDECCHIAPVATVRAGDLYAAYSKWSKAGNVDPMSGTTFGKRIGKRFMKRQSHGMWYDGIGVQSQDIE